MNGASSDCSDVGRLDGTRSRTLRMYLELSTYPPPPPFCGLRTCYLSLWGKAGDGDDDDDELPIDCYLLSEYHGKQVSAPGI